MTSDVQFEKKYNDLVAGLEKMHQRNVSRTRTALKSLLIIPTFFLIMLFMTQGNKTVFLVLWIASMFIIASILIIIEYQDYLLKKMFADVDIGKDDDDGAIKEEDLYEPDSNEEALVLAEQIRQSIQTRSPEFDVTQDTESAEETVAQENDSPQVEETDASPDTVEAQDTEVLSNT